MDRPGPDRRSARVERPGTSSRAGWTRSSAAEPSAPRRPTPAELRGAAARRVPDLIAPHLDVLFCGINPGLYSAATGHHFARPGNRFWPALHRAGFTDRVLGAWEERALLGRGAGITNLVARPTAAAAELSRDELVAGRRRLERKVRRYRPRCVAIVGIGAYRVAFGRPRAVEGLQPERLASADLWLLPNPSGLNANHQLADLARAFGALRAHSARRAIRRPAAITRIG